MILRRNNNGLYVVKQQIAMTIDIEARCKYGARSTFRPKRPRGPSSRRARLDQVISSQRQTSLIKQLYAKGGQRRCISTAESLKLL
jgi:hypothetical protein